MGCLITFLYYIWNYIIQFKRTFWHFQFCFHIDNYFDCFAGGGKTIPSSKKKQPNPNTMNYQAKVVCLSSCGNCYTISRKEQDDNFAVNKVKTSPINLTAVLYCDGDTRLLSHQNYTRNRYYFNLT